MNIELLTVCDRLMAAGLNGVYQGIALTVVVACALRGCGRTNAATRHAVWFGMLLLVAALIPAHYFIDKAGVTQPEPGEAGMPGGVGARAASPALAGGARSLEAAAVADQSQQAGAETEEESLVTAEERRGPDGEAGGAVRRWEEDGVSGEPQVGDLVRSSQGFGASVGPPAGARRELLAADEAPSTSIGSRLVQWAFKPVLWTLPSGAGIPRVTGLILALIWLGMAACRTGVLAARLHFLRRLKRASRPASEDLRRVFRRLCDRLGVTRGVELRTSRIQTTPVLLGFRHPMILLPSTTGGEEDRAETESILRHELAHVCRRDDWANLVQNFVQAAIFFHPAAWWICRRISLEREIACDDWVLAEVGAAREYALTLANLAARMSRGTSRLATGVSTSKSELKQRINMILNTTRNKSPRLAKTRLGFITSAAAVLAVAAVYAGPRLLVAQTPSAGTAGSTLPTAAQTGSQEAEGVPAGAVAVAPLPAPSSLAMADTTPAPPTPSVEPGPKFKPGSPDEVPEAPEPVAVGAPPPPPAPGAPSALPAPPAGRTLRAPKPPRPPRGLSNIEERLDHLERMMEVIMDRENLKRATSGGQAWIGSDDVLKGENKEKFKHLEEKMKHEAEALNQKAEALNQMARAEAARASKDANWAARDSGAMDVRPKAMAQEQLREASERQIEALQRARESLSRQMERLDRQIEKLKQDRERLEERKQSRGDNKNENLLGDSPDESSDTEDVALEKPGE